jgi:hypothetical protein
LNFLILSNYGTLVNYYFVVLPTIEEA